MYTEPSHAAAEGQSSRCSKAAKRVSGACFSHSLRFHVEASCCMLFLMPPMQSYCNIGPTSARQRDALHCTAAHAQTSSLRNRAMDVSILGPSLDPSRSVVRLATPAEGYLRLDRRCELGGRFRVARLCGISLPAAREGVAVRHAADGPTLSKATPAEISFKLPTRRCGRGICMQVLTRRVISRRSPSSNTVIRTCLPSSRQVMPA